MVLNSIKAKLIILLSALLVFSVIVSLLATNWIVERSQNANIEDALGRTKQVLNTSLEAQRFNLIRQAQLVGVLPILATVVENGDPATILDSSRSYQEELALSIFDVFDADGELLASVKGNYSEDDEASQTQYLLDQVLEEGKTLASLTFRNGQIALLSAAPIGLSEDPSGVLLIGAFLDDAFAQHVEHSTNAKISFLIDQKITSSSLPPEAQKSLSRILQTELNSVPSSSTDTLIETDSFLLEMETLTDIHDKDVGKVVIQYSLAEAQETLENIRFLLLGIGVTVVIIATVIGFFFSLKTIILPITALQVSAHSLADGELEQEIDTSRKDELGDLAKSFAEMRDSIRYKIEDLHTLNDTGKVLAGLFEQHAALDTVLEVLQKKIHVTSGSIFLVNPKNVLELKACLPVREVGNDNVPSKSFRMGEGISGQVAEKQQTIFIPDTSKEPDFVDPPSIPQAILSIPLLDNEKIFGVMNLSGAVGKVVFDESDREFVLTLAHMTVVTAQNIRMVNVIEEQNRTLENKVIERTAALKELMDNTGQGFLTFGENYLIRPEYSKPCQTFFGGPIEGRNALKLLFSIEDDADLSSSPQEILSMIFMGMGELDVLGDLLPKEIEVNGRSLALEYLFLASSDEKKFMLILTDVTTEKELAAQIEQEEERNSMILKVALDREGFIQFLQEVEKLFESIYTLLNLSPDMIDTNELFRYFHTVKGGTASYGLKQVSLKVHETEARLESVRRGDFLLTQALIDVLLQETLQIQFDLRSDLRVLKNIISEDDLRQTETVYKIKNSKIVNFREYLLRSMPTVAKEEIFLAIEQLKKQPIGSILRKYVAMAEELAERLEKSVEVNLEGEDVEVSYRSLDSFFSTLIHLIRNSVDHGIESRDIRQMLGKSETGVIKIEATTEGNTLLMKIKDDGGGIDAETVKSVALKKGVIDENQAGGLSEKELVMLIFAPGFSTKEEVTTVSGRGVGMDAVKTSIEELNGSIQVETVADEGTCFEIRIPKVA